MAHLEGVVKVILALLATGVLAAVILEYLIDYLERKGF